MLLFYVRHGDPIYDPDQFTALGEEWYKHPKLESFHFENKLSYINEQLDHFVAGFGYEHDSEKGLYKIVERNAEKRIAIFAHECMGEIVMSHLLDIPFPYYAAHFEMHTSSFTVIRFDDGSLYDGAGEGKSMHVHEYFQCLMMRTYITMGFHWYIDLHI